MWMLFTDINILYPFEVVQMRLSDLGWPEQQCHMMFSTVWDIMIHVGHVMNTVRGVQYRGGTQITKDDNPPQY